MMGLGGKTDPTYTYMLVNAKGGILETSLASTAAGAPLDLAFYNGIVSRHQQWQILAQGGNAEVNTATYTCNPTSDCNAVGRSMAEHGTTPMNNLGDGYFQIVNQNPDRRGQRPRYGRKQYPRQLGSSEYPGIAPHYGSGGL